MPDALVIRHAHRKPMPSELGEISVSDFDENQVPISLEGVERTRKFGLSLLGSMMPYTTLQYLDVKKLRSN